MSKPGSYKTLTNQKKIEILEEAENTGNLKVVARKYGVCPKSIRDWRKNKLKIKENIANGVSTVSGKWVTIDSLRWRWCCLPG